MTLQEVIKATEKLDYLEFVLPDGKLVPNHFHVTEVGRISKHFIDCGGKERREEVVNFQLWEADDYDHRLHPEKLSRIIDISMNKLGLEGHLDVEVEYQGETIGKYGLSFSAGKFYLTTKATDCLARENCVVPSLMNETLVQKASSTLQVAGQGCCSPDSGCC